MGLEILCFKASKYSKFVKYITPSPCHVYHVIVYACLHYVHPLLSAGEKKCLVWSGLVLVCHQRVSVYTVGIWFDIMWTTKPHESLVYILPFMEHITWSSVKPMKLPFMQQIRTPKPCDLLFCFWDLHTSIPAEVPRFLHFCVVVLAKIRHTLWSFIKSSHLMEFHYWYHVLRQPFYLIAMQSKFLKWSFMGRTRNCAIIITQIN